MFSCAIYHIPSFALLLLCPSNLLSLSLSWPQGRSKSIGSKHERKQQSHAQYHWWNHPKKNINCPCPAHVAVFCSPPFLNSCFLLTQPQNGTIGPPVDRSRPIASTTMTTATRYHTLYSPSLADTPSTTTPVAYCFPTDWLAIAQFLLTRAGK